MRVVKTVLDMFDNYTQVTNTVSFVDEVKRDVHKEELYN